MIDWLVSIPALLREPETRFSLSLTGQVVLITLLLHLIASLLLGYCLSKKSFPGRVIIDLLVTLPLVFPPVATGYALLMILGKNGPLRCRILARDVSLVSEKHPDTSILNLIPVRVVSITETTSPGNVLIRLNTNGTILLALITQRSCHALTLKKQMSVWAQIKSVAVLG
ncbi:TOBE domain-containing protein [Tolumonas auensis]|uniref:TOBE domain-containing protein n=1 Tax=Tolumonas auensis TaxID=43948 RepID=UPI002AA7FAED|nr:TOBE domain-containing protein [Tolumonas auensis]